MHHFLKIIFLFLLVGSASAAVAAETIQISHFSAAGLSGWSGKSFNGETEYRIVDDAGQKVLQAKSSGTASGLVFEVEYDPQEYPLLSWRWKIANTIAKGDSRTKAGDDYAARIYVVFPHWFFPKTKTLNYIWANRLPEGSVQANVYLSNAVMIAVDSGNEKVGSWVTVRRNIVADYRRAFGEDPPEVGAIAIMTDTDNTGESAIAWYGDILVSKE